jgi:hypothetical protein
MWAVIPLFDFVSARLGFLGFSAFGFLSLVAPFFFSQLAHRSHPVSHSAGAGSLPGQSVTECWAASVNPVSSGVAFPSIHRLFICCFAVISLCDFFV